MDQHNLMPHQAKPITRMTSGQLPAELAELAEADLSHPSNGQMSAVVLPSLMDSYTLEEWTDMFGGGDIPLPPNLMDMYYSCSYDGDDSD
jgi:bacteriocin leader peptide (microcyclamide/patellamide family)